MNTNELLELKKIETQKVELYLLDELRSMGYSNVNYAYAIAYVIVKADGTKNSDISSYPNFIKTCNPTNEIDAFISTLLSERWDIVPKAASMFDADMFKAFLLFNDVYELKSANYTTPLGLSKLVIRLLEISDNDCVADFCTGRGSFIRESYLNAPNAVYYGNEINCEINAIAKMRAESIGGNISIESKDVLYSKIGEKKFDKVFSNYPFAVKNTKDSCLPLQYLNKVLPNIKRSCSSDWLFNTAIITSLKDNGKGAAVVTASSLWNLVDKDVRRYFVDKKSIEAVIALPERLFEYTGIKTYLIIFGTPRNDRIRFINAQNLFTAGRRINTLTDDNIEAIAKLYQMDNEFSTSISVVDIAKKEYNLDPSIYFDNEEVIEDGVPFQTVIRNITRGAQIKAAELDKIAVTDSKTNYQFLMLADIQNGLIKDELSYISGIEQSQKKYCVKHNSLIISKNGMPVKTAIATVKEGQFILANGNMYIIELDESKVNPYFIKAYFESEKGKAALNKICIGSAISSISLESLKNLIVPMPDMEIQKSIATQYIKKVGEISELRKKIKGLEAVIACIYDDNM